MKRSLFILVLLLFMICGCTNKVSTQINAEDIPDFNGSDYDITINDNVPYFSEDEISDESFESYSDLDDLGRAQVAFACVSKDTMPGEDEERESLESVTPTGFDNKRYSSIEDEYLYNRCHLIMYALSDENANEKNLITGTEYFNKSEEHGMLKYELQVLNYIYETDNHVMYRVTPVYDGDDLVAKGVLMEAYSVEDNGEGVKFCVFVYNEEPGITIDHSDGSSYANEKEVEEEEIDTSGYTYALNIHTMKIHKLDCPSVEEMKDKNREYTTKSKEELIEEGYSPCGYCQP